MGTQCLYDELRNRFDAVLGMNMSHTAAKGSSMATFGLSGCVAGYIDGGARHSLFHFVIEEGIQGGAVDCILRERAAQARRVMFFVPGVFESCGQLTPDPQYVGEILRPALGFLGAHHVPSSVHGYALERDTHYRGTVWVDNAGGLFCEGLPVVTLASPLQKRAPVAMPPL